MYSRPALPNIQHCNLSIFRLASAPSVLLSDGICNHMQHCYSQLNSRAFISLSAREYFEREAGALKSCRAPSSTYAFYWLVLIHIKFKINNFMFKFNNLTLCSNKFINIPIYKQMLYYIWIYKHMYVHVRVNE